MASTLYDIPLKRIDGTDSVLLDRSGPAPVFDASQQITVPA